MAGFRRSRLRNTLVIAQITLSLVLLISAGLIVRSLQEAQRMRPGFNPENAVTFSFDVGLQGYDKTKGRALHKQALERMRAIPGVARLRSSITIPLASITVRRFTWKASRSRARASFRSPSRLRLVRVISKPWEFRCAAAILPERKQQGIPRRDRERNVREQVFPGQEAIGKRFNFSGPNEPIWKSSVCAGRQIQQARRRAEGGNVIGRFVITNRRVIWWREREGDPENGARGDPQEMRTDSIRRCRSTMKTMKEHMNIPLFPAKIAAGALGSFGVLALVLAAVGIYGVMSYMVAGRTREIGLRMALGAQSRSVGLLILKQGMMLALIGSVIGLALAFGGTRLLQSILYGVSAVDPVTFATVAFLLGLVALLACWLPAFRAARVDPMIALRNE